MYTIIVGCGRVGSELAKLLSSEAHDVVVIDKNEEAFKLLGSSFNGITIEGHGFDTEILKQAGITKADALCAVTNDDNTNIMTAQVAKKLFKVPKVMARIFDPSRASLYRYLGLDTISGTVLLAAMMRDKIIESKFTSYLIETGELGVIQFEANERFIGKMVSQANRPGDFLIVTIIKKKGTMLPAPDTLIEKSDLITAVVMTAHLERIKAELKI